MAISNAELELMKSLWAQQPLTVGQIIERVKQSNDWHDNTIKTMLNRLVKKEKVIKAYKQHIIALKSGSSTVLLGSGTGETNLELTEEQKSNARSKLGSDLPPKILLKGKGFLSVDRLVCRNNCFNGCLRVHQATVK